MNKTNKGFTLMEMPIVIAVISILVSAIFPSVSASLTKAKASSDAANLRNVLGQVNTFLVNEDKFDSITASQLQTSECNTFSGAKLYVLYCDTHFVDTYYVVGNQYYGIDYFSTIAKGESSAQSTAKPTAPAGSGLIYEWFEAGVGAVTEEDGE
jgi:prepilin-type N-terminal cleavage/methylation domain-containing protein